MEVERDIAVLKLTTTFNFNDLVKPACLPATDQFDKNLGSECWIAGYGATAGTNRDPITGRLEDEAKLRHTTIKIIDSSVCQNDLNSEILSSQICAGDLLNGADSCRGDSGGGLICSTEMVNGQKIYSVEGIVSWGKECGRENSPGVYTKVASYRSWLDSILRYG